MSINFFYRKTFTATYEGQLNESARNQLILDYARKQAAERGNETQIKKFKEGSLEGKPLSYFQELYNKRLRERQENLDGK